MTEDENGQHVTRRELWLSLKSMRWEMRALIVGSVIGNTFLSRVSTHGLEAALAVAGGTVAVVIAKITFFR